MEIRGVSAVVTGAASGLGLGTARRLLELGASVVIADLTTSNGEEVAQDLGDGTRFVGVDVTDETSFTKALDAAEEIGPLRVLVHCAGRGGDQPVRASGSLQQLSQRRHPTDSTFCA